MRFVSVHEVDWSALTSFVARTLVASIFDL